VNDVTFFQSYVTSIPLYMQTFIG